MSDYLRRVAAMVRRGWSWLAGYRWLFSFVKINLGYWGGLLVYDLVSLMIAALRPVSWSIAWRVWAILVLLLVVNRALTLQK